MRLAPQETRTYFVTTVTAQRRRLFQVSANADLLQQTVLDYRDQGRFLLHAFVIMPDHLHVILTQILNAEKFMAGVRYIEENPVRGGLVRSAAEYPYSSASCKALDAIPAHLRTTVRA